MLDGSIASLGSQYILALRAKNCATGDILADEQAQAARKEDVLGALSQMATQFRQRLGESLATIEKYSRPLQEATTASLDALEGLHRRDAGVRVIRPRAGRAAVRACDRDRSRTSRSPMRSSGSITAMRESRRSSRQSTLKAYQLRHRASDAERFFIETVYDRAGHGQHGPGAMETLEAWAQTLSARSHASRIAGRFRHEEHRQIRVVDRRSREGHRRLIPTEAPHLHGNSKAYSELYLNRLDAAEATIRRAEERKLASDYFLVRYFIAFLRGDGEGMSQQAAIGQKPVAPRKT